MGSAGAIIWWGRVVKTEKYAIIFMPHKAETAFDVQPSPAVPDRLHEGTRAMASDSLSQPLSNRTPYRFINVLHRAQESDDPASDVEILNNLIKLNAGHVYIAHLKPSPFYKIGKSVKVDFRLHSIMDVDSPFDLVIEHLIASNYIGCLEHGVQERFIKKHWRGEWYTLDEDDLAYLKMFPRHDYPVVDEAKAFIADYYKWLPPPLIELPPPLPIDFSLIYPRVYGYPMVSRDEARKRWNGGVAA